MNKPGENRTVARQKRSRWLGWIWGIPVAAIGVVIWLAVQAITNSGISVKITFSDAAGMDSSAPVRYAGMKIGEVSDLRLDDAGKHVIVTLSLHDDVKKFLRSGTRFWIVGASLGLSHPNSLKAMFTGPYIEMDPGSGKPTHKFVGLDSPPVIMSGANGTEFILTAKSLGSLSSGASINYLGLPVGKVVETELEKDPTAFRVKIFIDAPYDKLIHTNTYFWNQSPISVTMGGEGFQTHFASISAVTSGAIAFETPDFTAGKPAFRDQHFTLYDDKDKASHSATGPVARYLLLFNGVAAGDLKSGASVKLEGFPVGEVVSTALAYDAVKHNIETPVIIEIDPSRLEFKGMTPPKDKNWQPIVDEMLRQLIAQNLRAKLDHNPPVVGSAGVTLAFEAGAKSATLGEGGQYPEIPTTGAGGIGSIGSQVSDVVAEIKSLPLDQIAEDIRDTAEHVRKIAGSPQISESINHLDHTLENIESETAAARGKIGPLVSNLNKTADAAQSTADAARRMLVRDQSVQGQSIPAAIEELTRAARAVREVANYLDSHPEALLKGRPGEKE